MYSRRRALRGGGEWACVDLGSVHRIVYEKKGKEEWKQCEVEADFD